LQKAENQACVGLSSFLLPYDVYTVHFRCLIYAKVGARVTVRREGQARFIVPALLLIPVTRPFPGVVGNHGLVHMHHPPT
jgi:hypothetical protein